MTDSSIAVTSGSGNNVDTRTVSGDHRQVVVLGDGTNTDISVIRSADPNSNDAGIVVRDVNSSAIVAKLAGTIGIYVASTAGTLGVKFDDAPIVTAYGKDGTTGRALRMNSDGAIKVYELANGTVTINGTVTGITNSIQVHLLSTGGTIMVADKSEPTVVAAGMDGTTRRFLRSNSDGAIKVYDLTAGTVVVSSITASAAVHVLSTGGTLIVKLDPAGTAFVNAAHTVNIFTVAGSTSGVSPSGVTLVSPSANASFKVFAFSLQTTGIVSTVARFTNGAGSATEFWRGLVTSNQTASTPVGANLAVTPPGFLFATGASVTLALHLDNASLVHYSVSYIKESA